MKKLMIAAVAMAAGVAFADGDAITSQNIVGYMNQNTEGCESPSIGATFVPVAGGSTYKLGDLKVNGDVDPDGSVFQLLDPDTTETTATYAYCSAGFAAAAEAFNKVPAGTYSYWIGWWEVTDGFDPDDEGLRSDNVEISVGQGFLGAAQEELELVSSGSAPTETTQLPTDGHESPYLANYIPKTIKLGWITSDDGSDPDGNVLQLLDPDSTETTATYAYCSAAFASAAEVFNKVPAGTYDYWIGWWEVTDGFDPDDETLKADNVDVPAGQAFLGAFQEDTTFNMPSSLYDGTK